MRRVSLDFTRILACKVTHLNEPSRAACLSSVAAGDPSDWATQLSSCSGSPNISGCTVAIYLLVRLHHSFIRHSSLSVSSQISTKERTANSSRPPVTVNPKTSARHHFIPCNADERITISPFTLLKDTVLITRMCCMNTREDRPWQKERHIRTKTATKGLLLKQPLQDITRQHEPTFDINKQAHAPPSTPKNRIYSSVSSS